MKICCVASSGGHWEELLCLKPVLDKYSAIFVTERGGQAQDAKIEKIYLVDHINRKERGFLFKFFSLFIRAYNILREEKVDAVLTTGALIAFPFCIIGKILGKKIIYIESFARVKNKSMTGRLVYPFADMFIVQWPEMLKVYPKAIYGGGIF